MGRAIKQGVQKQNNKGLSLVEVLVAVIIMAVVSIVFLRSFSYSMLVNRDAEVRQDALTMGQSIMEAVKAYDLSRLDEEFSGTSPIPPLTVVKTAGYTSKSATTDADGKRTYTLNGVPYENNTFSATVEITPLADGNSLKTSIVTIEDFNLYNDAYFLQDPYEQDLVKTTILTQLQNQGYTGTLSGGTAKITERKLDVTIQEVSGADRVTVTSTYSYSASGYQKPDPANPLLNVPIPTVTGTVAIPTYTVYNIGGTKPTEAKLRNIYLYYYPAYRTTHSNFLFCEKDTITITNSVGTVKNVYLIKQKHPLLMTSLGEPLADLGTAEAAYTSDYVDVTVTSGNTVDFYSNINESLTGSYSPSADYHYVNCNTVQSPWTLDTATTSLIYDVKVTITDDRTGNVECILTGSTNHKRVLNPTTTP